MKDVCLPKSCEVRTLATWLDNIDIGDYADMARKVRALVEEVATDAVSRARETTPIHAVRLAMAQVAP